MTDQQTEHVDVDGHGVIEVFGDGDASALHVNFAPVLTEGWDLSGSLGRFATRLPQPWHDRGGFDTWMTRTELRRVRDWLSAPPRGSRVVDALAPLLQLLATGRYRVSFQQMPPIDNSGIGYAFMGAYHYPDPAVTTHRPRPVTRVLTFTDHRTGWYDWDTPTALLPTDRWPPRDTATIRDYRQAIRDGKRPAIVVLRPGVAHPNRLGGGVGYVIDGHHKLAAYLDEAVLPHAVDITAVACRGHDEAGTAGLHP